jgi:hypothetical protein
MPIGRQARIGHCTKPHTLAAIKMRALILAIIFLSFTQSGFCQTFLEAYKTYKLKRVDKFSNFKTRNKLNRFTKSHILELDTIFQSYRLKTNFNFNSADTLFLIYYSPAESPFTSDIIIWSGKDTISYIQGFTSIKPYKFKRTVTYKPFIQNEKVLKGFRIVTERDSIVTLVSKRDFQTINHLGDNQIINDGSIISIFVAYKVEGKYLFESCFPKKFVIQTIYKKE